MNRREFSKSVLVAGMGVGAGVATEAPAAGCECGRGVL